MGASTNGGAKGDETGIPSKVAYALISYAKAQSIRRQSMLGMGEGESCPFEFNFDPATFKVGDTVSYRVTGSLADFPFVGTLVEVGEDYVVINGDPREPDSRMRGTRESRPLVEESEAI
jgi:hypothetical protein